MEDNMTTTPSLHLHFEYLPSYIKSTCIQYGVRPATEACLPAQIWSSAANTPLYAVQYNPRHRLADTTRPQESCLEDAALPPFFHLPFDTLPMSLPSVQSSVHGPSARRLHAAWPLQSQPDRRPLRTTA